MSLLSEQECLYWLSSMGNIYKGDELQMDSLRVIIAELVGAHGWKMEPYMSTHPCIFLSEPTSSCGPGVIEKVGDVNHLHIWIGREGDRDYYTWQFNRTGVWSNSFSSFYSRIQNYLNRPKK